MYSKGKTFRLIIKLVSLTQLDWFSTKNKGRDIYYVYNILIVKHAGRELSNERWFKTQIIFSLQTKRREKSTMERKNGTWFLDDKIFSKK
jgi:hypothetical protein